MSDERSITARFTADTSGFSPKVNELIQHLKSLNSEYAANEQEIKRLNTEMKSYQKELQALEQKQRSEQGLTEKETAQMQSLRDSIARCATELGTYRSAQSTLRSDINQTSRELNEQRDAMNGVSNAAASFGDVLKANIISDAIHTGLQKTLELLKSAAAYCYDVGTSFESAMSQVEAISGASGSQLEALTNKAKQLGSTTKFTATQAAEAMNYMAMAGWDAEKMLSGIDGVIALAAANGGDLATTADIVTDAITAFKIEVEEDNIAHFADVLAAASASANTNVSMLGESFKYVAPLAGTMGYTIDEVAESLGIMANSGIKASTAGTSMRTMLTNLTSGVTITSKAFGEMKISAANADGSMKSLNTVLGELRTAFAQMTDEEKAANAEAIAGDRALSGFLALMNASTKDINELRGAIENCDGAAAKMAETMQDNLAGKVTIFQSALEGLGISVYDKFGGALRDVVDIFTDCISDMTASVEGGELNESISHLADSFHSAAVEIADLVSDNLPGFIDGIAKTLDFVITFRKEIASAVKGFVAFKATMAGLTAIKSLVGLFTSLTAAIKAAGGAQQALNAVMAANPFGVIATAVSALVIGISEFNAHTKKATESADDLREKSEQLKQSAAEYKQKASDLSDIKEQYEEIYKAVDPDVDRSQALKDLQDQLIKQFPELKGQIDLVTGAYNDMSDAIQGTIDKQNEEAKRSVNTAYNEMREAEEQEKTIDIGGYSHDKNLQIPFVKRDTYTKQSQALQDKRVREIFKNLSKEYDNLTYEEISGTSANDYWYNVNGGSKEKYEVFNALVKAFEDAGIANEGGVVSSYYNMLVDYANKYEKIANDNKQIQDEWDWLINGKRYDSDNSKGITPDFSGVDDRGIPWSAYIDPNDRSKGFKESTPGSTGSTGGSSGTYKEDKQLADDMYSVGEISAEEYYQKLVELRDEYLTKGTHEWYQATAQIQSAYAKTADGIANAAKKSSDAVKDALDDVKSAYKSTLDAIDAELEKHNRGKQDKEYQTKIDALSARLKYEQLDDFSRIALEKELADVREQWDEAKYKRNIADKKELLNTVYTQAQSAADYVPQESINQWSSAISSAIEQIGGTSGNTKATNSENSAVYNIVVNAQNKTTDQIVREVTAAISKRAV